MVVHIFHSASLEVETEGPLKSSLVYIESYRLSSAT